MRTLSVLLLVLVGCKASKASKAAEAEVAFMNDCQTEHKYYQCAALWSDMHKEACGSAAARNAAGNAFVGGMVGGMMSSSTKK